MNRNRAARLIVLALTGTLLVGCIERKERITILDDGRVHIKVEHETESYDEMYAGDAVPRMEAGWVVAESVRKTEEGKDQFKLVAEASFPAGFVLPASYAAPRDADPDVAMHFPTELRIEERRDGVYYHFSRRYTARPWAYVQIARDYLQEKMGEMEGRSFEDMTEAERASLIRVLARVETMKYQVFAREAFGDALDDAPQDAWLLVYAAIRRTGENMDFDRIAGLLLTGDQNDRDKAMEAEVEAFEGRIRKAMEDALRDGAGITSGRVNAFVRRFNWHKKYYEITEELADDKFTVVVEMPGEIVGHNAERSGGNEVTWEFSGEMIRDREVELMVTSRVVR